MSKTPAAAEVGRRLAAPFPADELGWLPLSKKVGQDGAVPVAAYLDVRTIEDRLDDVLGPGGWQDAYLEAADGCVVCTLRLRVEGDWVSRSDVGGPSDQPDLGDRRKAAFTDALKRASVKFGIGRYLAALTGLRAPYDVSRGYLTGVPEVPAWAMPGGPGHPRGGPPSAVASKRLADRLVALVDAAADGGALQVARLAAAHAAAINLLLDTDLERIRAAVDRARDRTSAKPAAAAGPR